MHPVETLPLEVLLIRLDPEVPVPRYFHADDAGADLVTTRDLVLPPGERAVVGTGIAIALPAGYAAFVHPRSGLAAQAGLGVVNAPGTIDAGYRGELQVCLVNHDLREPVVLRRMDRIAQLVVQRVEHAAFREVTAFPVSSRGTGGYGSTGTTHQGECLAVFGRSFRAKPQPPGAATGVPDGVLLGVPDGVLPDGQPRLGPYDVAQAPDDGQIRLDLGSLRLPVPQGAQLQVEVDTSGPVRAVHLITDLGQFTITAFAAPRSGGLWREVCRELVTRLRAEGARVGRATGEWGEEIEAVTAQEVLRFLAVDGPRWMLRGVAAGPAEHADARTALLRDVVRHAVVVRGPEPLPVRSPLPLQLPGPLAEQLKQLTSSPG